MSVEVVMLDRVDHTLHRPGSVHMVTACGVELDHATIGPRAHVEERAARRCSECWPEWEANDGNSDRDGR